jgi:mRNA interferase MazF
MSYQWGIYLAGLDPVRGSEQAGQRPILVISREMINQVLPVVNVVPLTSLKSPERKIYANEV